MSLRKLRVAGRPSHVIGTALICTHNISPALYIILKEHVLEDSSPFSVLTCFSRTMSLSSGCIRSTKEIRANSSGEYPSKSAVLGLGNFMTSSWIIKMASFAFSTKRRYFSSLSRKASSACLRSVMSLTQTCSPGSPWNLMGWALISP
ncbi:hypothetical protein ES703_80872 [subsurface metagenome]